MSYVWSFWVVGQLFCISSCLNITMFPVTGKQLPNGQSCCPELGICGVKIFCCGLGCISVFRMLFLGFQLFLPEVTHLVQHLQPATGMD